MLGNTKEQGHYLVELHSNSLVQWRLFSRGWATISHFPSTIYSDTLSLSRHKTLVDHFVGGGLFVHGILAILRVAGCPLYNSNPLHEWDQYINSGFIFSEVETCLISMTLQVFKIIIYCLGLFKCANLIVVLTLWNKQLWS